MMTTRMMSIGGGVYTTITTPKAMHDHMNNLLNNLFIYAMIIP